MKRRSIVTSAALAGGLLAGIVFGPTAATTTSVSAQTPSPSASAAPAQSSAPAQSAAPSTASSTLRSLFLDQLAAALNIDRSALDTAIASAGNSTADAAVAQGTLTQAQADSLKARIRAGDVGALWGGRGGSRGERLPGLRDAMSTAAAGALGISVDELNTQLESGQTLAQLATEHSTTEQAVIDAALAAAKTELDSAVGAGTLTQAQADAKYAQIQAAGASILSRGSHGPRGRSRGPAAPASPAASPATTSDA
ncbi:MAG TPA: hypothetical protein VGD58_25105 [Herpetosiphonaceae bacterium]